MVGRTIGIGVALSLAGFTNPVFAPQPNRQLSTITAAFTGDGWDTITRDTRLAVSAFTDVGTASVEGNTALGFTHQLAGTVIVSFAEVFTGFAAAVDTPFVSGTLRVADTLRLDTLCVDTDGDARAVGVAGTIFVHFDASAQLALEARQAIPVIFAKGLSTSVVLTDEVILALGIPCALSRAAYAIDAHPVVTIGVYSTSAALYALTIDADFPSVAIRIRDTLSRFSHSDLDLSSPSVVAEVVHEDVVDAGL